MPGAGAVHPNLHTGLIITPDREIVGPASASHSTTLADETALITDDPDAIAATHVFFDGLDDTIEVDEVFLDHAASIWQVGRVVPLVGIGERTRTGHDFLPTPACRRFLRHLGDYTPTTEDETAGPNPRRVRASRTRATAPSGCARTTPAPLAAPASSLATS